MNHEVFSAALAEKLAEVDPSASGSIHIEPNGGQLRAIGSVVSSVLTRDSISSIADALSADTVGAMVDVNGIVVSKPRLVSSSTSGLTNHEAPDFAAPADSPDRIGVIYQGELALDAIKPTGKYKRMHIKIADKMIPEINLIGLVSPIILAADYSIIDGELRYHILKSIGYSQPVPVVVIDAIGDKADFVRLVLNRSAEFQRWIYPEVDELLDRLPQIAPALEPLGFFGNSILPTSFFSGTVFNYRIIEEHEQQKAYSQEHGLAAWAEERRAHVAAAQAKKEEARTARAKATGSKVGLSLFDLDADEVLKDALPTHDPNARRQESVEYMKEIADRVTTNFDAAVLKKNGVIGQNSRRSTKVKTADNLAAAELASLEAAEAVDAAVEFVQEGGDNFDD